MTWSKFSCMAASVVLFALSGCGAHEGAGTPPAGATPQGPPPAPVHVAVAESESVPVEATAFGSAESISTVELRAQVSGEITAIAFKEGDAVMQGQELFRIDPRPYEVALAQAEANLARYEAELKQAEAMLRENEVRAENARVELGRNKTLLEREIVTQEEFDRSRTAAEAATASTGASSASVNSARENIRAAKAEIDRAKLDLERSVLRAPMDGRTGSLMAHVGDIVNPSSGPLVNITQVEPIYVSFTLPERYLPQLRTADATGDVAVRAQIPQSDAAPVEGVLTFIDNTVDRVTSTIRLKATFANAGEDLWPGQYLDVRVQLGVLDNVVTVPERAVQTSQQGTYVYVVGQDNVATLRPITTGPLANGRMVVSEGLSAGERIVTDGHLRVKPNGVVKVLEDAAPKEAPTS